MKWLTLALSLFVAVSASAEDWCADPWSALPPGSAERAHVDWLLGCALGRAPKPIELDPPADGAAVASTAERAAGLCQETLDRPEAADEVGPSWPDILRSARSLDPASHQAWLASCLDDVVALGVGGTRADVRKAFRTEGGVFTRDRQTYVHCRCRFLLLEIRFEPSTERSADRIRQIGPLEIRLAQTD